MLLHQKYPGTMNLPHTGLATLPTPMDDGARLLEAALGSSAPVGSLRVKRDDLTSDLYGGNKVRKLEYLLGEALSQQRRAVITFGAYGSNHALATAVHASSLGLEPHVVLSPQAPGPFAARTLRAHAGVGTRLHPVEGWDGSRVALRLRDELAQRDGIAPAIIPMGGTSAVGVLGYVEAAFEVLAQAPDTDVVYAAGGTLGTVLGLAIGFAAAGSKARVVSVRVTPAEVANLAFAEKTVSSAVELLRAHDTDFPRLTLTDLAYLMRDEFFEPGYGIVTPETTEAVSAASAAGFTLETTYTGKALHALLTDARAGALRGEHVVFLDTYNSAPMPAAGSVEDLPRVLHDYVMECDALFA